MCKKNVVVTGASSGIGKAVADKYCSEGYYVIGLDINPIKADYQIFKCDISDETQVKEISQYIKKTYGMIHYLLNCAGIFYYQERYKIVDMSKNEWEKMLSINLTGTMLMIKYMIPLMCCALGDRAIVNISSDQVLHPRINDCAYAVSKSGINCLTRAAACELLTDKIRVNAVEAASVRTNFIRQLAQNDENMESIYDKENDRLPLELISPSDIADLCFFLGSNHSSRITGQIILVNSGLYL